MQVPNGTGPGSGGVKLPCRHTTPVIDIENMETSPKLIKCRVLIWSQLSEKSDQ